MLIPKRQLVKSAHHHAPYAMSCRVCNALSTQSKSSVFVVNVRLICKCEGQTCVHIDFISVVSLTCKQQDRRNSIMLVIHMTCVSYADTRD